MLEWCPELIPLTAGLINEISCCREDTGGGAAGSIVRYGIMWICESGGYATSYNSVCMNISLF